VAIRNEADIDLVKKIVGLRMDKRRDCRKEFSSMGPRIKAINKGADS
jgi:hypothetical protein